MADKEKRSVEDILGEGVSEGNFRPGKKANMYIIALGFVGAFFALDFLDVPSKAIGLYSSTKRSLFEKRSYVPEADLKMDALTYLRDSVCAYDIGEALPRSSLDSLIRYSSSSERFSKEEKMASFIEHYKSMTEQYGSLSVLKDITKEEVYASPVGKGMRR